jgi:F-type H+-transporting ATPase subunit delta
MALTGSGAKRYAEALLDLAEEAKAVPEWTAALERISQGLGPEALRLLTSPSFPVASRRAALERATAGEPAGIRALLQTLLERERIALLPAIVRAYHDLLDDREGIERAVVLTAVEMDESRRREIVSQLERGTGKRLRATFVVDPSIKGGVVLRIGDHQIDGSVRTRLALMRQQLAQGRQRE